MPEPLLAAVASPRKSFSPAADTVCCKGATIVAPLQRLLQPVLQPLWEPVLQHWAAVTLTLRANNLEEIYSALRTKKYSVALTLRTMLSAVL